MPSHALTSDVTVSDAVSLVTPFADAVMLVVPAAAPVATPSSPIVAADVFDEAQAKVTPGIGAPLASTAIAVKLCVSPTLIVALVGSTRMTAIWPAPTTNVAGSLVTPFQDAVIFVAPGATPCAIPSVEIDAMSVADDFHVNVASGMGWPSASTAVAVYGCDWPTSTAAVAGEMTTDIAPACGSVEPPHAASRAAMHASVVILNVRIISLLR